MNSVSRFHILPGLVPALCILLLLTPALPAAGEDLSPGQREQGCSDSLGINYPGASLKVFLSKGFAAELRGQYEDRIFTAGVRLYYYPSVSGFKNEKLRPFISFEGDRVSFKGELSKGNGAAFGALGGVEYFVSRRFSVQTDAGPYYIMLKDGHSAAKQNGLEFVINCGFNFYF